MYEWRLVDQLHSTILEIINQLLCGIVRAIPVLGVFTMLQILCSIWICLFVRSRRSDLHNILFCSLMPYLRLKVDMLDICTFYIPQITFS